MLSWQIGAVKITCVVEMLIPFPEGVLLREAALEALKASPWLFPHFAKEDGTLIASVHAVLVEAPGLRLVVDTCIGNDKPRHLVGGNPLATPFLQHRRRQAGAATVSTPCSAHTCTWTMWAGTPCWWTEGGSRPSPRPAI